MTITELFTPPPPVMYNNRLSPAEWKVAELIADGWNNSAIAEKMFITVHTVEKHINSIYAKMELQADCKGRHKRAFLSKLWRDNYAETQKSVDAVPAAV